MADYGSYTNIGKQDDVYVTYTRVEEGTAQNFRKTIDDNFSTTTVNVVNKLDDKIDKSNEIINEAITEIWRDKHGVVVANEITSEGKKVPGDNKGNKISQATGEIWFKIIEWFLIKEYFILL